MKLVTRKLVADRRFFWRNVRGNCAAARIRMVRDHGKASRRCNTVNYEAIRWKYILVEGLWTWLPGRDNLIFNVYFESVGLRSGLVASYCRIGMAWIIWGWLRGCVGVSHSAALSSVSWGEKENHMSSQNLHVITRVWDKKNNLLWYFLSLITASSLLEKAMSVVDLIVHISNNFKEHSI